MMTASINEHTLVTSQITIEDEWEQHVNNNQVLKSCGKRFLSLSPLHTALL